jgi:hypothetical protein
MSGPFLSQTLEPPIDRSILVVGFTSGFNDGKVFVGFPFMFVLPALILLGFTGGFKGLIASRES